jgi:hypothetical protein
MRDDRYPPTPLEMFRSEAGREAAIEAGREEGFPGCCAAFFAEIWAPLRVSDIGPGSEADSVLAGYLARVVAAGFDEGYIPCPACLRCAERGAGA